MQRMSHRIRWPVVYLTDDMFDTARAAPVHSFMVELDGKSEAPAFVVNDNSVDIQKTVEPRHEPLIPKILTALSCTDPKHESLQLFPLPALRNKVTTQQKLPELKLGQ